jgi:hypothetical protein
MAAVDDVDQLIDQYQRALDVFMKGDPKPVKELFSHREDVILANPLGPPAHGWDEVGATIERAATQFRDGRLVGVRDRGETREPRVRLHPVARARGG